MTEMNKLIVELARAREDERAMEAEIEAIEAEIETMIRERYGEILASKRSTLAAASDNVAYAEARCRRAALMTWNQEGTKNPHQEVKIKLFDVLIYDEALALDYARQHIPSAVKLNVRPFEKAAKVLGLAFVTVEKEARVEISRDLTAYL